MIFILLLVAIGVFYWYYKTWGKQDFLGSFGRGAKGFAKGFASGVMEERLDEFKRKMNYYVIALLAKIAKSDGRVSEQEADMISQILDANAKDTREREFLKASFNEHKENLSDALYVAREFIKEVPLPLSERFNVLRVLVFMALIDGDFSAKKQGILEEISKAFGISNQELNAFIKELQGMQSKTSRQMGLDEAFSLLELDKNADLNAVKKSYRLLAKKYHPDILNANNVSEAELKKGVENFQKINEAYELIKKHLERKN
ncbi:molecular chaperone DjlA [Campylobacter sp. MIT 99-7217]|uniref:TerB family tellurite resistance protein n=1 Tax=Campylobacter sp. MIT 99-7217 TaxID=535091 RepID=UPI0011580436|nr:TerB family tellurite resistance protein [Campylobacter sp. MIT 99-7217]TQR34684.1 molecular chaperone DjlA [Campylobacter sp. MIT 99-7217]